MTFRSTPPSEPAGVFGRILPTLLVLLSGLFTSRLQAQPAETMLLEWSAPKGCPGAEEVRARVRKLAGSTELKGAPLRAEGTITRNATGDLHLRLIIRQDELVGERNLDGTSCSDLAGAASVALALLLRSPAPLGPDDLTGSAEPGDTSPGDPPAGAISVTSSLGDKRASSAPSAAPRASATSTGANGGAAARTERGWRVLLQLPVLGLGLGPLHKPSYGLSLAAGASVGRWLGLAEGRAWLPQRTSAVQEAEQYHAELQRYAAGLRGGYAFLWSRFQLVPCVALSIEHLSARGGGPHIAAQTAKTTWLAVALGLQARVEMARWLNLVLGIDLQLQTSRPTIAIGGVGVIEQLLPFAANVTFGLEWIF